MMKEEADQAADVQRQERDAALLGAQMDDLRNELAKVNDANAAGRVVLARLKREMQGLHGALEFARTRTGHLERTLFNAEAKVADLKTDLGEALDLAHRLLAKRWPSLPHLTEKRGNIFLLGRALLKKHGLLEDVQ